MSEQDARAAEWAKAVENWSRVLMEGAGRFAVAAPLPGAQTTEALVTTVHALDMIERNTREAKEGIARFVAEALRGDVEGTDAMAEAVSSLTTIGAVTLFALASLSGPAFPGFAAERLAGEES